MKAKISACRSAQSTVWFGVSICNAVSPPSGCLVTMGVQNRTELQNCYICRQKSKLINAWKYKKKSAQCRYHLESSLMCTKPDVPMRGFAPQRTTHSTGRTRSESNIHVRLICSTYCAVNIPCHPAERGGSMSRWHWQSTTSEGDCATVQSHPHYLRLHSHTHTHTHAHTHTHTAAQPLHTPQTERDSPFPFHFRCCFTEVRGCRYESESTWN